MTLLRTPVALACGALVLSNALAQDNDEPTPPFDQIIVSGARTPIQIGQTGAATSVISRADIERRQSRYLSELLRTVPGFSVSHTGVTGSQTQVRVRGSEANHVLVLIDGVRANDPATGDEFRWEHLSVHDVERIEIVRGAQSALWGSDAVGAVVHIITQSAGAVRPRLSGYVEAGSNNTRNAGFGGSLGDDDWSVRANVERLDTDGENVSRQGSERDGSDLTTASLSATWRPSDSWSIAAGVRSTDASTEFDPVDFFTTGLPVDGDRRTDSENVVAHITATSEPSDRGLSHRMSARYYDSNHDNFVDGQRDGSTGAERYRVGYQANLLLDANVLSLAVEHERTDFSQRGAVVFGDPNQDQRIDSLNWVAEYQYLSGERLSWLASARYDDNSDFEPVLTGRFSLAYRLNETTKARASIGRGHKNPTFTERFGFFPGQFVGNPDLEPERSTSYEVGLDRSAFDGALNLQATVFYQDLENEINGFVFDPNTFLTTAENRTGDSERSGVEIAGEWRSDSGIRVAGSYTYTDASEANEPGTELREIRRPRHTGSVSTSYVHERFDVNLTADFGGSRIDTFFPPFPQAPERVTLDAHWLLDLTFQYRVTPAISIFARGSNRYLVLLDDDYEQVFGFRTLGRTAFFGVRAQLGGQ